MENLITIYGKGKQEGNKISGYALPKTIKDFQVPSSLLVSPNFKARIYKESCRNLKEGGTSCIDVPSNIDLSAINIVDKNIEKGYLITREGFRLRYKRSDLRYFLISPKLLSASVVRSKKTSSFSGADGDGKLITINGTAQDKGKSVSGYALPKDIKDFKIPATILFVPNYSPTFHVEDTNSKTGLKQVDLVRKPASVNIVDVDDERKWLITDDGYVLGYNIERMLISPKLLPSKKIDATEKIDPKGASNSNKSPLEKKLRNIQIGVAVVGWSIFGLIAWKKWDASLIWKGAIVSCGVANAYNTYRVLSKPALNVSKNK